MVLLLLKTMFNLLSSVLTVQNCSPCDRVKIFRNETIIVLQYPTRLSLCTFFKAWCQYVNIQNDKLENNKIVLRIAMATIS